MNSKDLRANSFFTTDGTDIWALRAHYVGPSCDLENLETKKTRNFGMGGLTAQSFHRIEMPILVCKECGFPITNDPRIAEQRSVCRCKVVLVGEPPVSVRIAHKDE